MNRIIIFAALVIIIATALYLPSNLTGLIAPAQEYACPECNIVLFTIDTVRADHVSSYGYFQETTPNMDRLASQGLLFEEAYIQIPFTPPSHWSIMTGLYPFHHGMYLPTDTSNIKTLATHLSRQGYVAAAFTSSYMVGQLGSGFTIFDVPDVEIEKSYRPAGNVSERALSWLDDNINNPFFLWVHYFDAHSPYNPPNRFDRYNYSLEPRYAGDRYSHVGVDNFRAIRQDLEKYDGEVSYVDSELGRVLNHLDELGLADNTIVVVVSDHGENFGEHDFSDFGYEFSGPCLFHDKTLYQEEVHVPLIIKNPLASQHQNRMIPQIVESVDLVPTILDTLGFPIPEKLDGTSLKPLIEGNTSGFDRAFFQLIPKESGTFAYGLLSPEWKFVRKCLTLDSNGEPQVSRLLFSSSDPGEQVNVHDQNPEEATPLEEELLTILGTEATGKIYIDTRTEEILRLFGYLK